MCHVDSERNCGTWGVGWLHVSISTFFFKHFLQGIISLRCSMVTFVYLIFPFCSSNFCMESRTSGAGWLHDSILFISTFFFEHFLQGIIRWLLFFISSLPSFLSTFCQELRTSGVGWLHCSILVLPSFSNTFCKELWTSDIGWLHPHRDTSQTVYKLLADI